MGTDLYFISDAFSDVRRSWAPQITKSFDKTENCLFQIQVTVRIHLLKNKSRLTGSTVAHF